ncbi:hypothetical protein EV421DRAFT_1708832, partial [Armillaria borealis]
VEATGSEKVADDAINYVRRGGTLMIYGVYANADRVHWSPSKIFGDEIRIIGSFAQTYCFPRAVAYLDSGKINVKGMVRQISRGLTGSDCVVLGDRCLRDQRFPEGA